MTKKIAFITGASSGIGEAIARKLAAENYCLILNARREDRILKLKTELEEKYNASVLPLIFDIRKRDAVKNAIENLPNEWKEIDVLVNNAGLASGLSTIFQGDIDDWEKMIDTNVKGLLFVSRAILPLMVERKTGHVINIGSIAAKEVYTNGNVYCSTKFAVDALNKAMRIELFSFPVKVTAIHPGAVETEFSIVRFHGDAERAGKVYEGFDSLHAEDIAEAAWFVLSRPQHVNINELTIMPTAQPMSGVIHRK